MADVATVTVTVTILDNDVNTFFVNGKATLINESRNPFFWIYNLFTSSFQ